MIVKPGAGSKSSSVPRAKPRRPYMLFAIAIISVEWSETASDPALRAAYSRAPGPRQHLARASSAPVEFQAESRCLGRHWAGGSPALPETAAPPHDSAVSLSTVQLSHP